MKKTKKGDGWINKKQELKLIKIKQEDKVKGFYILLTKNYSSFKCFRDEKYIVPKDCLKILEKHNIRFKVL